MKTGTIYNWAISPGYSNVVSCVYLIQVSHVVSWNAYTKSFNNVELNMYVNFCWMMFEQIWILFMLTFSLNIRSTF